VDRGGRTSQLSRHDVRVRATARASGSCGASPAFASIEPSRRGPAAARRPVRRRVLRAAASIVALFAGACGGAQDGPPDGTAGPGTAGAGSAVAPDTAGIAAAADQRPGIRFDPAAIRAGDRVGGLVLDSIAVEPTVVDSTHVGSAWFGGEIQLAGTTLRHFDADLRDAASCFEADAASAALLPRWLHDERRPWLCFENPAEARAALGPPADGVAATLVVDRFTIHRTLSDAVNSARFVRRVR
jgi:hypothetical protein